MLQLDLDGEAYSAAISTILSPAHWPCLRAIRIPSRPDQPFHFPIPVLLSEFVDRHSPLLETFNPDLNKDIDHRVYPNPHEVCTIDALCEMDACPNWVYSSTTRPKAHTRFSDVDFLAEIITGRQMGHFCVFPGATNLSLFSLSSTEPPTGVEEVSAMQALVVRTLSLDPIVVQH